MAQAGIADLVFAEINKQLDGHGLILRKGTLVDATLVEAQAARPKPPQHPAPVPPGEKPISLMVHSKIDPDAPQGAEITAPKAPPFSPKLIR